MRKKTDPKELADSCVATWQEVHATLAPIIGARGVSALYRRSVSLRRADFPWLARLENVEAPLDDLSELHRLICAQASREAAAANDALLRSFGNLLTSLIGIALARRLLESAWAKHQRAGQDAALR